MPNHITNRVQIKSLNDDWRKEEEAFKQLEALMKTEESTFDFNVLIPYPEKHSILDKARHEAEKNGTKWDDLPKDGFNQGGYEWCTEHWGTKWNAYDIGFDYNSVYFQTAWSTPLPIWQELSKRFPDLRLEVEYADEDRGSNCGRLAYMNGKQVMSEDLSVYPYADVFARAIIAEQKLAHKNAKLVTR